MSATDDRRTDLTPPVPKLKPEQIAAVAPAFGRDIREKLEPVVWHAPALSMRDRSLVTMAALITRNQAPALTYYADKAMQAGVSAGEVSEIILHLAYYAGFGSAMAAIPPVTEVFAKHGVRADQLPAIDPVPLPLDEAAEAERMASVEARFGTVSPGLIGYTTDFLFRDLWLRPDLGPRDRSLVTVASLVASGNVQQIGYHLGRAMDAGLTREEAGEVLAQIAFYTGWPNAFSAMPSFKDVFEQRGQDRSSD